MDLHNEILIEKPAVAVWDTLGERFAHVSDWAAPITESSCTVGEGGRPDVGTVRACSIEGFGPVKPGVIKERLLAFDRSAMSLEYEAAEGMPGFVARAVNRWSVHAVDEERCRVRIHATLTLRGPMKIFACLIKWQMQSGGANVAEELKYFLEQGAPHPRKLAAQARR